MWIGGTLLLIPLVIDLISLFQFVPELERPHHVRNSTRRRPVARHQGNRPLYKRVSYRAAQWRIESGLYPVRRVGKIVIARKSELDEVYERGVALPKKDAAA